MRERWKEVAGFPAYQVSTYGRVRSKARSAAWRYLRACANGRGYLLVQLHAPGRVRSVHVHRLVAETFLPAAPGKTQVAHLDGSKTNNRLSNLAWATGSENAAHKELHGTAQRGERGGLAKLTDEQVRWIRAQPRKHGNQSAMARLLGVCVSSVNQIVNRKTWVHLI